MLKVLKYKFNFKKFILHALVKVMITYLNMFNPFFLENVIFFE